MSGRRASKLLKLFKTLPKWEQTALRWRRIKKLYGQGMHMDWLLEESQLVSPREMP